MGVSTPALPSVEYDDINPGMGTLNKDPKSKGTSKRGIHFNPGDVLFGKLRPYLKNWLFACFEGVAVGDFWVLTSSKIDHGFIYSLIQAPGFQYIANLSSGSKMPRSDWGLVSNARTFIPTNLSEQESISSVLFGLDTTITLHEEKKRQLERLKSALLQKMFADKSGYPAIRFEGFDKAWEERKLKELGDIQTGNTPPTSDSDNYSLDGVLWVTPTDIKSLVISNTAKKLSQVGVTKARIAKAGSILVTSIASIGKNTLLRMDAGFNQQINSLTPTSENDSYFLLTQSEKWSEKMKQIAASATMQIVNKTEFSNISTYVPVHKEEQEKIGSFFKHLDDTIALHQQKINNINSVKKSLLQKMFI
ncbi:restriction endonuclease subunit S [Lactobacillus delbrueckii]|uniref:restriction endonuclease subunit S n=1 Tax=Lactobacillus delbrueckii TaxID=1584 RepID=UPI001D12E459|nr:restriction endonuclease subunit S [Lactobacillus delbrueckii]UPS60939.1 restriction endonuclease subunit S [Lactobacillus delbrueckii subsp. bulgaricus]